MSTLSCLCKMLYRTCDDNPQRELAPTSATLVFKIAAVNDNPSLTTMQNS